MSDRSDPSEEKQGWFHLDIHPWVFFTSAILIIGFVAITVVAEAQIGGFFDMVQGGISKNAGWLFIWTVNIVLVMVLVLLISRFGDIRIGGPDARPEFSTSSWFAMLFSAGMGIGLLFYGVAEPIFHYAENPFTPVGAAQARVADLEDRLSSWDANPAVANYPQEAGWQTYRKQELEQELQTARVAEERAQQEAARMAMDITFLHWGFHPWAIYTLVALSLAFFSFNKGLPLSIRTAFYPLLGERIYGPIGNIIDIMATVATLFGVATSLGVGVQQVNAGLNHVFEFIPQEPWVQVVLIAAITAVATWSVVRGLDKGIRFLSEVNIVIASLLALFVLLVGPTLLIIDALLENIGYYIQNLPRLSTWRETYETTKWQQGWTIFYWAWWIAWSPFVGMFIARVSYGRTIRTFVAGVLLAPSFVTFVWMTIFGNTALSIELFGDGGIVEAVNADVAVSLFALFDQFPLSTVTSLLGVAVVIMFFVTSSDSGSMVIDIITSGGNPNPPVLSRLFWAILEGVVAASLLMGGGLVALQTAAITTGLPFAVVILGMCFSLWKGLSDYVSPQAFTLETEAQTEELHVKRKAPLTKTFGRRRLW